ncbi:suppressor of fused domain protein [[Pseudopropionibacterium] massiliense]|uniref:suppressor of fused domain protein n=1 Tax=[Pseudopropionibacterium] massiliense TaxID=2220000 RepID=UPI001030CAF1|nr:suppressor of fused domain protein [[Pseudopropionibacterium] massiliense]
MGIFNGLFGRESATGHRTEAGTEESPGWEAITEACERVYPDQIAPFHIGTLVPSFLSDDEPDEPLDGISVYRAMQPRPHWHYVTYGLTDLYGEQGGSADGVSGYGFELTFRLADDEAVRAKEPPAWPLNLLQNLARYVLRTGNGFAPNHHIDANGPISLEEETTQTALGFIEDPDLGSIETPNGSVQFVQLVGLTAEDLDDVNNWDAEKFFALLTDSHPKGVTDLRRASLRATPEIAARISEGRKKDGSQMGQVFIDVLRIASEGGMPVLTIGARVAGVLGERLNSRLPHGREFLLHSPDAELLFLPGGRTGIQLGAKEATLTLDPADLSRLAATLRARAGQYMAPDGVIWNVERTEITDNDGNVIETIG